MEANFSALQGFVRDYYIKYGLFTYISIIFIATLVFSHATSFQNQLILGTIVNCILFLSAKSVSGFRSVFLVVFPSTIAFLSGFLFGPASIFILYAMPFIWLGNFAYVKLAKRLFYSENRAFRGVLTSSVVKACIIFAGAFALNFFNIIPSQMLVAFGPVQLLTAFLGGFFAIIISKALKIFPIN